MLISMQLDLDRKVQYLLRLKKPLRKETSIILNLNLCSMKHNFSYSSPPGYTENVRQVEKNIIHLSAVPTATYPSLISLVLNPSIYFHALPPPLLTS